MPHSNHTVCVLDDEPSVLRALGRLLMSDGFRVLKFCEPQVLLDHARNQLVEFAVIDIRMPGMSGLEVLAELQTVSPDARVIVITGESDPSHKAAALAGGACAFFLKPFDDELFLQAVRKAISA
ncbi:response regulator [Phragmitibacter flavus]|uniref:response regulator n=1 Tax=Phragmitibacter flavus TaxID=2576071 RepID=UPI0014089689|nr:response regulator [Phragmitibacter flavus]